jgi:molybdopterin-binding protein
MGFGALLPIRPRFGYRPLQGLDSCWHAAKDRAILLAYCIAARDAKENPGHQITALPDALVICADLTVMAQKEIPMRISARNQLKGAIVDVVKGATTSHIRIDIGGGVIVMASITNEAVDELTLTKGKAAVAVIKASDVMVGVE